MVTDLDYCYFNQEKVKRAIWSGSVHEEQSFSERNQSVGKLQKKGSRLVRQLSARSPAGGAAVVAAEDVRLDVGDSVGAGGDAAGWPRPTTAGASALADDGEAGEGGGAAFAGDGGIGGGVLGVNFDDGDDGD